MSPEEARKQLSAALAELNTWAPPSVREPLARIVNVIRAGVVLDGEGQPHAIENQES